MDKEAILKFAKINWFKIGIIVAIVFIGILIFTYASNKNELVRQAQAQEALEKKLAVGVKIAQEGKTSCLEIYQVESKQFGNVNGWRYDSEENTCYIEYRDSKKKTQAQCDETYKDEDGVVYPFFWRNWAMCVDGVFEKEF